VPGVVYFIQAHHKPHQLRRLVGRLHDQTGPADRILVHYDGALDPDLLSPFERVAQLPRRAAEWGGISLVDLALAAIDRAVHDYDPDWMIYISGQDYPLIPAGAIADELERSGLDGFISARPVEALRWQLGRGRYLYRYPGWARTRLAPGARRLIGARNAWLTVRGTTPRLNVWRDGDSMCLGLRRHPFSPEFRCWTGSQWWSLSRRALRHVLTYVDAHPEYRDHFMRVAFASDEAFFNSILANATALRIEVDDNLRYLRLDDPDWAHPTTLTSDDATRVLGSGKHFARKLDLDVDERLFDVIDANVDERRRRRLTSA
jgi:hypothetical protein